MMLQHGLNAYQWTAATMDRFFFLHMIQLFCGAKRHIAIISSVCNEFSG